MISFFFYSILLTLSLTFLFTLSLFLQRKRPQNIPPAPSYLPILGNLHQLKMPLHETFLRLSRRYGPVFSLRFGSRLVVVVSSPSGQNDIVLANRPPLLTGKYLAYNYTTVVFAPFGDHWRNLRRIMAVEVLSTHRLKELLDVRRDEINRLVQKLMANNKESLFEFTKVEMRSRFSEMAFNSMMRMISGKRYWGDDDEVDGNNNYEALEFRELIKEVVKQGGGNNPGEFLPFVRWFDLDGLDRKLKKLSKRLDGFLQGLLDEHRNNGISNDTVIRHLLTLQQSQPDYYSDQIIKGLALALLVASTDTTTTTLEWALSSLLNHPDILKKAKEEIDTLVRKGRLIEESDIPYLQNIVSETLRLYPAAPLLLTRFTSSDSTIEGYNIPGDTIVLINAWALNRDPQLWNDPTSFKPERFEKDGEVNKLFSFGSGRRACPGSGLAQRTINLTLGFLIQCFEWKCINEKKIDMTVKTRPLILKSVPLEVMRKAHHHFIDNVIFKSATNE